MKLRNEANCLGSGLISACRNYKQAIWRIQKALEAAGVEFLPADECEARRTSRAGTLDDPNLAKPAITIWTKMAPSWACIDAKLPQEEGQPPPPVLPSK
jgi:hypothetical protein